MQSSIFKGCDSDVLNFISGEEARQRLYTPSVSATSVTRRGCVNILTAHCKCKHVGCRAVNIQSERRVHSSVGLSHHDGEVWLDACSSRNSV